MFYIQATGASGLIKLSNPDNAFISDHKIDRLGDTIFVYNLQATVDLALTGSLQGGLEIAAYTTNNLPPSIKLTSLDFSNKNFIKAIDKQRMANSLDKSLGKRFFVRKSIDYPDLKLGVINFQIDIPKSKISDKFIIEAANINTDGSRVVIDSISINHQVALQRYDLPSQDFYLTTCRDRNGRIYATAATQDPLVGSFRFLLRNDASTSFNEIGFSLRKEAEVDLSKSATAYFDINNEDQKYSIRAYPITKFLKQSVGNYKEESSSLLKGEKYLPFYLSNLTNSVASFNVLNVGPDIVRVFLYRKDPIAIHREYVSYSDYGPAGAFLQDISRNPNFDYVYTIDYLDNSGIIRTSPGESVVQAIRLDNLAKIKVLSTKNTQKNQQIKKGSNQRLVSFDVKVDYSTASLYDSIIEDLKVLGLEGLYSSDLQKMTNNLKPITRVIVSKISKLTGVESYVGVYSPGIVTIPVENDTSQIVRFEVAVRSVPESLESLTAAQDVISKNAFNLGSQVDLSSKLIGNRSKVANNNFSSKFYSKSSINQSTLRYGNSSNIVDIGYFSGRTGIFYDVQLDPIPSAPPSVTNISKIETKNGYYVRWSCGGDTSKIDKFRITVNSNRILYSAMTQSNSQIFFLGKENPSTLTIEPITTRRVSKSTDLTSGN